MTPEEHVKYMAHKAQTDFAHGKYTTLCRKGEPVFFVEHSHALLPGHIYSGTGVDEFRISGICEFHFDEIFKEEE